MLDTGVLSLRKDRFEGFWLDDAKTVPRLKADHPAIREWRAMTVILLYVLRKCCLFNA